MFIYSVTGHNGVIEDLSPTVKQTNNNNNKHKTVKLDKVSERMVLDIRQQSRQDCDS